MLQFLFVSRCHFKQEAADLLCVFFFRRNAGLLLDWTVDFSTRQLQICNCFSLELGNFLLDWIANFKKGCWVACEIRNLSVLAKLV